jgi:hypothetical protein
MMLRCGLAALTVGVLLAIPLYLSGCTEAGAVAYAVVGDIPTDAEYNLARVPTLVMVENYPNADESADDADILARYIIQNLNKNLNEKEKKKEEKKKLAPIVFVDTMKLYDLRTLDANKFHKMKIQEIGRRVGARQVVYVSLDSMSVQSIGRSEMMRGVGSARVKVVNCVSGQTLWPQESGGGYPVGFESNIVTPQQDITYHEAQDKTMRAMAKNISQLFYKHGPDDDDNNDDQFSPD